MTIIIFILVLGVLVLVHEFGHFISAKTSGMRVEEFGFGFPPRLFGVQKIDGKIRFIFGHPKDLDKNSTVYSFNLLPLGGFVKIFGENNDAGQEVGSFSQSSFAARLKTLLAGVFMNVVLAWVIFTVGLGLGMPAGLDDSQAMPAYVKPTSLQTTIIEVQPDSKADLGGLKMGDKVLALDGKKFAGTTEIQQYIKANKGKTFSFSIERMGNTGQAEKLSLEIESVANPQPNQGSVGISMTTVGTVQVPWVYAPLEGLKTTGIQLVNIMSGLYGLVSQGIGLSSIGGPVKIAQMTGEVNKLGFIYLMQFTGLLSLNLAILNCLPIPALDGGRVLFLIIEKLRRRPNNAKFEQVANAVGFMVLIGLMLLVTIKDVSAL